MFCPEPWLPVHQAKRLHSPSLIITHHDASLMPTKLAAEFSPTLSGGRETRKLCFDRVLCDVPCSGDGTLRKAPDLWRRWGEHMALGIHRMQCSILRRGLKTLVPGGRLVYSTCSMNPIEDEAVVSHALLSTASDSAPSGHPAANEGGGGSGGDPASYFLVDASAEIPELRRNAGVDSWRVRVAGTWYDRFEEVPDVVRAARRVSRSMFPPPAEDAQELHLERCMRVLPHMQDTGGFFIAVIQRAGGEDGGAAKLQDEVDEQDGRVGGELVVDEESSWKAVDWRPVWR